MTAIATPVRTLLHLSDTHILPDAADRLHGVDSFQNVRDIFQRVEASGSFDSIASNENGSRLSMKCMRGGSRNAPTPGTL